MNALGAREWAPFFSSVPAHFRQFTDPDSPHIKGVFRLEETKPPFVSANALPFHSSRRGEAATRTRGIPYLAFGRRRRRRPVRAPRGTRASPLSWGRGGEPIGFSDAKTTSAAFRRSEGDDKLARRR